ncbi:threonine aldolase [Aspergillus sclerotioniger CBS 115572]|uniref:alcohol dehydrogenase n=1 Tax=Aspergillus sclerotioniger CBS 115572 TaxID=1450535 RepID=A0A317VSW8_9EURO|nr:threonine aldolase [Aspergillus sclerotioniger CBS 115572]PWY76117.1 threonine aldolase [Aspergillus sclerotioniger CBS 115572]
MTLLTNGQALPPTQWAHVFKTRGQTIELKQIPVGTPGPDEVLVQMEYSGVCHTDLHAWKGDFPPTPKQDLVGGHEGVGLVAAIGTQVNGLRIGDTVGIQFCSTGNQPLCPKLQLSGYMVDGTFQQYCICKADNAVRIPPGISLEAAAPVLCAGITVYKALKESNVQPGQVIAIVGAAGGLGSLAVQYAKACGHKVLALSSGSDKRQMCLYDLRADYFVDYKSPDVAEEARRVTGGGPHAAMIVSSVEEPFHQATQYIRPGGTIVAVGLPPGKISTDVFSMVTQKISIKGSYVGNREETEEALAILIRAGFSVQYDVVDFAELPNIYDLMERGQIKGRKVLKIGKSLTRSSENVSTFCRDLHFLPKQNGISGNVVSGELERAIERAGGDFRSDTVTVPTEPVMQAIINVSTFGDDIYDDGGDPAVNAFQDKIKALTGKEAALFVLSGTQGNQICLRTHLHQPPHTILLDYRAHVQVWETGAIPLLSQATVTSIEPKNGIHLTLDDVKDRIVEEGNIHFPPTRVVSLENTLSGSILPLEHAKQISNYVRNIRVPPGRTRIAMHLDGARLLEATTAENVSVREYLDCFDSASICISKGCGAPMGSVIVGSKEFIDRAVWFRKMFGGATRQTGMMAAAASAALDHCLPLLPKVHALTRRVAEYLRRIGYEFLLPVDTNMIVLDLKKTGVDGESVVRYCDRYGLRTFPNGRLAFHHQISEDGVARLQRALLELITDLKTV